MTGQHQACQARFHGTATAYTKHRCRCPEGLRAWRSYKKRLAAGLQPRGWIDATGTHRRIQAMQLMGHSQTTIGARVGVTGDAISQILRRRRVRPSTAHAVAMVCAELGMRAGTSKAATTFARRKGWMSLLAWDNIDDLNEQPDTGSADSADSEVDHAAVTAAVQGMLAASRLRIIDRRAAVTELAKRGRSVAATADVLRTTTQMVTRDLRAERGAAA